MAALDEVDSQSLNEVLLAEERGVVLDFWGTWCQPCRTLRPHLEGLADKFESSWRMVAVHVEEQEDIVAKYDVQSTPSLVFLKQGEEVARISGAVPTGDIEAALEAHA